MTSSSPRRAPLRWSAKRVAPVAFAVAVSLLPLSAAWAQDSPPTSSTTSSLDATTQAALDALDSPSPDLLAARDTVLDLTAVSLDAQTQLSIARSTQESAQRDQRDAEADAARAERTADIARDKLGQYAATAYISGGDSAAIAATLSAGSPTEMVVRRNTLVAVADTRTDLVNQLQEAQQEAASAALRAQSAAERAGEAEQDADEAATQAAEAAAAASTVLSGLIAKESAAQDERLAAMVALAQSGSGSAVPADMIGLNNGQLPDTVLSDIAGFPGQRLWPKAARAFEQLVADAAAAGVHIGVTDSYRPLAVQESLVQQKGLYSQGGLAATPGTSRHGWGLALDLSLDATALAWMREHAGSYGFVENVPRESWHWEFIQIS